MCLTFCKACNKERTLHRFVQSTCINKKIYIYIYKPERDRTGLPDPDLRSDWAGETDLDLCSEPDRERDLDLDFDWAERAGEVGPLLFGLPV